MINKNTLKCLIDNTKIARSVIEELKLENSFFECFHLRPTANGITVVSTLPFAPMRGLNTTSENDLLAKLNEIIEKFKKIRGENNDAAAEDILEKIGFLKRKEKNDGREENIQAHFINGMIKNEPLYNGIKFVASELTLNQSDRFDVVGFKDSCLYIFELKKDRDSKAFEQANNYVKFVQNSKEDFLKVLSIHPHCKVDYFEVVKGIAILRYAHNQKSMVSNTNGIDVWYYEDALSFRKQ